MYEQELADIKEVADKIIDQYEEVFHIEYGDRPEFVIAGLDTIYEHVDRINEAYGLNPSPEEKAAIVQNMFYRIAAFYDDLTHTVLIPKNTMENLDQSHKGALGFVIAHELGHGFQHNYGYAPPIERSQKIKEKMGSDAFSKDPYTMLSTLFLTFPEKAVSEGMADYMATNVYSSLEQPDQREQDVIEFAQKKLDERKLILDNYNILIDAVQKLEAEVINKTLNPEEFSKTAIYMNHNAPYSIGFAFVDKSVNEGKSLVDLIANPPQSIEEMIIEE